MVTWGSRLVLLYSSWVGSIHSRRMRVLIARASRESLARVADFLSPFILDVAIEAVAEGVGVPERGEFTPCCGNG